VCVCLSVCLYVFRGKNYILLVSASLLRFLIIATTIETETKFGVACFSFVALYPSSLRTQQLKQLYLVTLLEPLGIVRQCYVFLVRQQLKQRRFYGMNLSSCFRNAEQRISETE
jgi:hypothetical protein